MSPLQPSSSEFERLANRVIGLPHQFLLSCFISGLSPEIRREVQAFQPLSVPQATTLAKIQEDKIEDRRKAFRQPKPFTPSTPSLTNNPPPPIPKAPNSTNNPKVQFRKLSQEEMASHRERNLCYNCDETFTPQHRCKGRFFMLISEEDLDIPDDEDLSPPTVPTESPLSLSDAQLSMYAMSGHSASNTFRILGTIANTQLTILVDSGNTHNFIQTRVAKFLGLHTSPAPHPFKVMVGNGSVLTCSTQCANVTFSVQGHSFTTDFFLLPLGGAEVVLGVPWLISLGPILMDYTTLQMNFTHLGQPTQLCADAPFKPKDISIPQVKRCVATNSASLFL